MKKLVFFDLETTGFRNTDEILSIGMVNQNGEVLLDTLIRPIQKTEWKEAEAINHITPEMVKSAPSMEEIQPELNRILQEADMLIAYGINFDYRFLKHWLYEETQKKLKRECCLEAARNACPGVSHKLSEMMNVLNLEWTGTAHSALPDAEACRKVWNALKKEEKHE